MLLKIIGVSLITVICFLVVKQYKMEIAVLISLAGGLIVLIMLMSSIGEIFVTLRELAEKTTVSESVFASLLKIIGIGYITEFSADIADESGNKSIANKIIFAGKVAICLIALPIIKSIIELIVSIL